MGNGNVLRVVGRDARGRESVDLARAARFVREHATELGVGAALLGGAILAGTLHKNWAVPREPVNDFDLHTDLPGQAPVARLPVPAPNVAKVEISDQPSRNPVSAYRAQSLRSEADPSLPAPEAEQAQPKEEWELEEVHAKLETPVSATSDPPKSTGVSSGSTFLDQVNAARASAETKRAADMKNALEKLDEERRKREERIAQEKPARDEEARRRKLAENAAFRAYVLVDDQMEDADTHESHQLQEAYKFLSVKMENDLTYDDPTPSDTEVRNIEKAMNKALKWAHTDNQKSGDRSNFDLARKHYKFIQGSQRMKRFTGKKLKSFGNNTFGEVANVSGQDTLGVAESHKTRGMRADHLLLDHLLFSHDTLRVRESCGQSRAHDVCEKSLSGPDNFLPQIRRGFV
jgi:hypothetical protein